MTAATRPSLADLYETVAEDQAALLRILQRIFVCETLSIVELTPKERHELFRTSVVASDACTITKDCATGLLPRVNLSGPFIFHHSLALLFIRSQGEVSVYLSIEYARAGQMREQLRSPGVVDMLPHIKQAVAMSLRIGRQESDQQAVLYVLDHYPIPSIAIDNNNKTLFSNLAARRLCGHSPSTHPKGTRNYLQVKSPLNLLGPDGPLAESRMLRRLLNDMWADVSAASRYLRLTINNVSLPVVISPATTVPLLFRQFSREAVVWVYILKAELNGALKLNARFQHWGLSVAETELASRLFEGMTLKEIADARNVSAQTVRKQLQSVFRKTRCDTQEDLMKFLFEQFIQHELI